MLILMHRILTKPLTGGLCLLLATAFALICDNSPWQASYHYFLDYTITIGSLTKSLTLWINEGLMTLFFLLVGIELKREFREGQFTQFSRAILPIIAAIGGMVAPGLIYVAINYGDMQALRGWAIPLATDIAFALGVLSLLTHRLPSGLVAFMLALAVIDDLGAIVIIALFHANELMWLSLLAAAGVMLGFVILRYYRIVSLPIYGILGIMLWFFVLKSGIHATVSGVILALFMPLRNQHGQPLALQLEAILHPWVTLLILPLFALANAGVPFEGLSHATLFNSVPLGIIGGLVLGKPLGVWGATYLTVRARVGLLPQQCSWLHLLGLAMVCGIGFTMSLFIGTLAMPDNIIEVRLGVIVASLISGGLGYMLLRLSAARSSTP